MSSTLNFRIPPQKFKPSGLIQRLECIDYVDCASGLKEEIIEICM